MPAITPLLSAQQGVIDFHGLKIIYGVHPLAGFSNNPASGGYRVDIDISQHHLTGSLWASVSAEYELGRPEVTMAKVTATRISLLSNVNLSGAYAHWMIVGITG